MYTDRKEEEDLVKLLLDEVENGQKPPAVVGFYGVPGIGKTTLAKRLTAVPMREGWTRVFIADPNRYILPPLTKYGSVFFIIDNLEEGFRQRPEIEEAIEAYLMTNRAVVVAFFTSGQRWPRFEIRRRVQLHRLRPLTLPETAEQLEVDNARATAIFAYSAGLPGLGERLRQLTAQEFSLPGAVRSWLNEELLVKYDRRIRPLITLLAVPYLSFDADVVSELSGVALGPEWRLGDVNALRLLGDLSGDGLVSWDVDRKGYILNPPLRPIFLHWLKETELWLFLQTSERLIGLFEVQCGKAFNAPLLAELLYLTAQAGGDVEAVWSRWMSPLADHSLGLYDRRVLSLLRTDEKWQEMVGADIAGQFLAITRPYL